MQASRFAILGFGTLVTGITLFSGLTVPGLGSIDAFADDSSMSSLVPGSSSAMSTMSMSSLPALPSCTAEIAAAEAAETPAEDAAANSITDLDALDSDETALDDLVTDLEDAIDLLGTYTIDTSAFDTQLEVVLALWDDVLTAQDTYLTALDSYLSGETDNNADEQALIDTYNDLYECLGLL